MCSALIVSTAASGSAAGAGPPAPGAARSQGAPGAVALVAQTPWVSPGGQFDLTLRVTPPPENGDLEVVVTVFPAVATRSDFALTLDGRVSGNPVAGPLSFPLSPSPGGAPTGPALPLERRADGTVVVHLPLQDPSQPRDPNRALLPNHDGVLPARIELRRRGDTRTLDRFITHLIYLPGDHSGPPLGLAMALPLGAPLAVRADGTRRSPKGDLFAGLGPALDALRNQPVAVIPTPETVEALASSTDGRADTALGVLKRAASQQPLVAGSYVPVNVPLLVDAGLQREVSSQLDRGARTIEDVLKVKPDGRTWVTDEPLDQPALALLATRGVERVVVREDRLVALRDQRVTLTAPFSLPTEPDRPAVRGAAAIRPEPAQMAAAAVDPGLAAYFDSGGNQALLAHRLLADLTVLFLDHPGGDRRAAVVMPPPAWTANAEFLKSFLAGLEQNPVVAITSLDDLFGSVPPARDGARPLVRRLKGTGALGLNDIGADIRAARRRLDSLGAILGPANQVSGPLDERLLASQSADLRTSRQRSAYVEAVDRAIDSQLRSIRMPEGRSITLTSRQGEIPVTFQNRTGGPVKVVVRVDSDKLEFPGGTTRTLDLVRRNTTERFPVVARTSGAFPVRITLVSPDGNLVVGRARLTVRSTAASGVSLVVSIGALLFLAVWWGRHALKGRRAKRLVPA